MTGSSDRDRPSETEATIVVVTARDEADRIAATIGSLRAAFPGAPIVVGDDGSHDETASIAREHAALVVTGARRGKGQTATIAAERALEIGGPGTVYLLCDADLGCSARLLSELVEPVRAGDSDHAIAVFEARRGGGVGLALGFARGAIRRSAAVSLDAPISGQRALSARALRAALPFASGFGMELAMTIDALRAGEQISEVVLPLEHRATGRTAAGFVHRGRQLRDFAVVYFRRYRAPISSELAQMREQVYTDLRPKEYFDAFHAHARTRDPSFVYEIVRFVSSLYSFVFLRARSVAAQNVPEIGAVILAPNHFSFLDHFLLGAPLRRKVRFMGKSQLFKQPLAWVYMQGGVFPVRRGARDDDTFITAEAILARAGVVAMYCEGGRSRTGRLSERAKPGIGRLALESGAPVVPVAIVGSSRIRNWKRLRFPAVTVEYGEPLRFAPEPEPSRERQQEVADAIFDAIKTIYNRRLSQGRTGLRSAPPARVRSESLHADD